MRIDDLIGVPFLTHGRDASTGFDCYGLAIEVSKRMGHELPELDYQKSDAIFLSADYRAVIKELGDKVKKVDDKKFGDLLLFKDKKGRAIHIGVSLEGNRFIHCDRFGVRVLNVEYYNKNYEVYRWQK